MTQDQAPNEEPEISVDEACRILAQAATGQLTLDDRFKAACSLGASALRESALFWPKQLQE